MRSTFRQWFSTGPSTEDADPSLRSSASAASTRTDSRRRKRPCASAADNNSCYRDSTSGPDNDPTFAFAPSPEALNSASLTPKSPSPQPATPRDVLIGGDRPAPSVTKPIDIATPTRTRDSSSSASPVVRLNSTTGFDTNNPLAIPDLDFLDDIEMTTGPAIDSAMGRSRQDSFVSAGPKPISMSNPNREHGNRQRRESLAGSLAGTGMSWQAASFGSFVREE